MDILKKLLYGRYAGLVDVLLAVLVLWFFYGSALDSQVPYHFDEGEWIGTSLYLDALDPNFQPPAWMIPSRLDPALVGSMPGWVQNSLSTVDPARSAWRASKWTLTQPPVTRYIIGLSRRIAGVPLDEVQAPINAYYLNSDLPLLSTRTTMAVLAVISGLLLFLLIRACAGRAGAYMFAIMYGFSPYFLLHLRRAMSESPLLLFTVLVTLCATLLLAGSRRPGRSAWLYVPAVLLGVFAGLAGAVKLNGLGLVPAGVAVCLVAGLAGRQQSGWGGRLLFAAGTSLVVVFVAVATFVIVNPFLYPDPVARTTALVFDRVYEMAHQVAASKFLAIRTVNDWMRIVPARVTFFYSFFPFAIFNVPLFAIGLFHMGQQIWRWLRGQGGSAAAIALLAVMLCTGVPALFTPLDWDRYYLYPVAFFVVGLALGFGKCAQLVVKFLNAPAEMPQFVRPRHS